MYLGLIISTITSKRMGEGFHNFTSTWFLEYIGHFGILVDHDGEA